MEYRIIRSRQSDDYIEHAIFGGGRQKGAQNKNHKYLARAWIQNKWRYAYTQAEVRALENWGKGKDGGLADKQKVNQLKRESAAAKKVTDKIEKQAKSTATKVVDNVKNEAASKANIAKTTANRAVDTAKNAVSKTASNVAKTAKEKVEDIKSGVASKQANIKAQTAVNDVKNLATRTGEGIKTAASNAKKAVDDFKNYSSDVNKRNADAAKKLRDTKLVSKAYDKASKEYEELSKDKGRNFIDRAVDSINAQKAKGIARQLKKQGLDAQDDYDSVKKEKESTKYKLSDLVSNGKDSRVFREGKAKASSMLKEASEKVSDTVDTVKSEVKKQTDLAKNAAMEAKFDKYGKESIKKAENKISKIDKEIAEYEKEAANDPVYKESNAGWLKAKQREREQAVKDLENARDWQKDWEESDKTLYTSTGGTTSTQRKQNIRGDEPTATEKAASAAKSAAEKGKAKAQELLDKTKSTAAKAYDKATDEIEKVRESDAMATVNKAVDKVKDKVSDAAESIRDKASDAKAKVEHQQYANEMKRKYGADSLHYKDAQAFVEHDKTVDELAKARDNYGVNSSEYKAAARKEQAARDKMDDVHEQNLYANNAQYKKISDQASALGSYISNMDSRGGPQTKEGKANYQKAIQDLRKLEAQLERMWNEDWE